MSKSFVNSLKVKLQKYIEETLSIEISILPWKEQGKLPFFLSDAYGFFETSFLNHSCLLMVPKDDKELTPTIIQKHWEQVTKKWQALCIYTSNTISSYSRKQLIQHHIPFIIPNNQIYLPDLGVDLQEHFKQQRTNKESFSPAAQAVIIFALLKEKEKRLIPSELANELGYSFMTMTRVFNELEDAGIGKILTKGKERWWVFEGSRKELWEQTKDMLRSPVRRREPMKSLPGCKMPQWPLSNLSALAEITMINPPKTPVLAMGIEEYKEQSIPKGVQLSHIDEAEFELEIWNYNPKLYSEDGLVDRFSLYLSLKETKDERVEAALEKLLGEIKWLKA